jgi:hypothetical protein
MTEPRDFEERKIGDEIIHSNYEDGKRERRERKREKEK